MKIQAENLTSKYSIWGIYENKELAKNKINRIDFYNRKTSYCDGLTRKEVEEIVEKNTINIKIRKGRVK